MPWLTKEKKEKLRKLCGSVSSRVDLNKMREYHKYGETEKDVQLYEPADIEGNLDLYLDPIEIKIRNKYLELVQKHGNGLWALEELEHEIFVKHKDEYESLNKQDKYILNMYIRVLKCLYK